MLGGRDDPGGKETGEEVSDSGSVVVAGEFAGGEVRLKGFPAVSDGGCECK